MLDFRISGAHDLFQASFGTVLVNCCRSWNFGPTSASKPVTGVSEDVFLWHFTLPWWLDFVVNWTATKVK